MIHTGKELAAAARELAKRKTIYVMGCFGAPMTAENKGRYIKHDSYNQQAEREKVIRDADSYTFGFDCVGLIKGLLWGWDGTTPSYYGGADYMANGVADMDANRMLDVCQDISVDFSRIQPGEVLGMRNHIGIYLGDGLCAESTPRWEDGVQITEVHNVTHGSGVPGRMWLRHGKLPWLSYEKEPKPVPVPDAPGYTFDAFLRDVQNVTGSFIDGKPGPVTLGRTVTVSAAINKRHMVVLPLQRRLKALGFYQGTLDGTAGSQFTEAVVRFQKANQLHTDGEITAQGPTWRKLIRMG